MLASRRSLVQKVRPRRVLQDASKRKKSTTSGAEEGVTIETVERPTNKQLWRVFNRAAVPMIGFGFTDQTVMLQAGNAIDCTLGVTFGLSTLVSALINAFFSMDFRWRTILKLFIPDRSCLWPDCIGCSWCRIWRYRRKSGKNSWSPFCEFDIGAKSIAHSGPSTLDGNACGSCLWMCVGSGQPSFH